MKFCPKCGSICLPKKEGDKTVFECKCGHKEFGEARVREEVNQKQEEIRVVDSDVEVHPKTPATCTKCGNKEAYFWEIQTRSGDEAATAFFKCTKCKHTWREYK